MRELDMTKIRENTALLIGGITDKTSIVYMINAVILIVGWLVIIR